MTERIDRRELFGKIGKAAFEYYREYIVSIADPADFSVKDRFTGS